MTTRDYVDIAVKPDTTIGYGNRVAMYICSCGKRFVYWFDGDHPTPAAHPVCPFCQTKRFEMICTCSCGLFNAIAYIGGADKEAP